MHFTIKIKIKNLFNFFFSVLQKSSSRRYPVSFDCSVLPWIYSIGMDISSALQLIAPGTLLRIYTTQLNSIKRISELTQQTTNYVLPAARDCMDSTAHARPQRRLKYSHESNNTAT